MEDRKSKKNGSGNGDEIAEELNKAKKIAEDANISKSNVYCDFNHFDRKS